MAKWRNRPTSVDNISEEDADYIILVDESGNSNNMNYIKKCVSEGVNPDEINGMERYLTVSACIINVNDFYNIRDYIMQIKKKYWENGLFENQRVCFHSTEIKRHMACSGFKLEDSAYSSLTYDIRTLLNSIPITLISTCVDKYKHAKKYFDAKPMYPYNLCITFLMERIIMCISKKAKCSIILEARGEKEDRNLLKYMIDILDNGTHLGNKNSKLSMEPECFENITGIYFNPKWNSDKSKSYWGLELADMYSYTVNKFLSKDNAFRPLMKNISSKLYKQNEIVAGRGFKLFPLDKKIVY